MGAVLEHSPDTRSRLFVLKGNLADPPDIAGHEQNAPFDLRPGSQLSADKSAQTVSNCIDAVLVKTIGFVRQDKVQNRLRILQIISQGIVPVAPPVSAVMKRQNVKANPAQGLGEVKILFAAGYSVKKDDRWVNAGPLCRIEYREKAAALAGDDDSVQIRPFRAGPIMFFQ